MQLAAVRVERVQVDDALTVPRNRLAGHGHAFGLAGRTRGVNQVRQMPAQRLNRPWQRHLIAQLVEQQTRGGGIEGHPLVHIAVAQQQAGR